MADVLNQNTDPTKPAQGPVANNAPNPYQDMSDDEYAAQFKSGDPTKPQPQTPHPVQTFWQKLLKGPDGKGFSVARAEEMARGVAHGVAQAGMEGIKTIGEGTAAFDRKTGLGEALSPGYNDQYDAEGAKGVVNDATADGQQVIDHYLGRRSDDPLASFTESASQFMAGWAATGELSGLAKLGKGAHAVAGLARGAVIDGTMFDPYQAQLAELAAKAPVSIAKQLGALLSVKGDDGPIVARLKRAAAGLIPATTIEGLVAASRVVRAGKAAAAGAPEALKEAGEHAATVSSVAAGTYHPEGADLMVNPQTLRIDDTRTPIKLEPHPEGSDLVVSPRSMGSAPEPVERDVTQPASPVPADQPEPVEGAKPVVPTTLPPNGQGFTSPVFSDYIEASQQAESMNAALQARATAGQVDEGQVRAVSDNVAKALQDPSTENLAGAASAPLDISYHTSPDDAAKIAQGLSEKFAKSVRAAVDSQGEVHVAQSMQMALNGLGEVPGNMAHAVLSAGLERLEGQSAWKMATDLVMKSYQDNIGRLTDAVTARPHDVVAAGELRTGIQNYFDLQDKFLAANSDAARALRLGQERPNLSGADVKFADDAGTPKAPLKQTPLNPADVNAQKKMEIHPLRGAKAKPEDLGIEKSADDVGDLNAGATDTASPVDGAKPTGSPDIAKGPQQEDSKLSRFGSKMQTAADKVAPKYSGFDLTKMSDDEVAALGRIFKMSGGEPRNAAAISQAAQVIQKGGPMRVALELFTNGLLSGPATAQTILSSAATLTNFEPVARGLAGLATGNVDMIREAGDLLAGSYRYAGENMKVAAAALRDGRSIIDPAPQTIAIGGRTGKLVRIPGNVAGAAHEMAKVTNYRAWVYAKSMREGRASGLDGQALASYVDNNLRASFSKDGVALVPDALKYGQLNSLSSPLAEGSFGAALQDFTKNALVAKFIAPFVKISSNVINYTWQSTPGLNLLNAQARETMQKGGEEAAILHARSALAGTLGYYAYSQASQGNLTGRGPSDPQLRSLWLKDNQPYSFRMNKNSPWHSYQRFEPLAKTVGLMADLHTIRGELQDDDPSVEHLAYAGLASISNNLASSTYMKGIMDFANVWGSDNPQQLGAWLQNQAVNMTTPALLSKVNPDPVYREVRNLHDAYLARVPGYSETLDPRYSWAGEPILKTPGVMNRMSVSPTKPHSDSAVEQELLRQNQALTPFPQKFDGIDLSDRTAYDNGTGKSPYRRMMELVNNPPDGGPNLRQDATDLVQSADYKNMPDAAFDMTGGPKMEALRKMKTQHELTALQSLREEYPKLDTAIRAVQDMKRQNATGGGDDAVKAIETEFGQRRPFRGNTKH